MSVHAWEAWENPEDSAAEWLEAATRPWREDGIEPTTDQLLQAAQAAALLAIAERIQAQLPFNQGLYDQDSTA